MPSDLSRSSTLAIKALIALNGGDTTDLVRTSITEAGLKVLSRALRGNKTIRLVDLCDECRRGMRDRFDDSHHSEPINAVPLSLIAKLALISAITNGASSIPEFGNRVERWILTQIFDFAGSRSNRMILWTKRTKFRWRDPVTGGAA